ncbi:MAG: hypothetical protein LBQ62_08600 [Candidatus Accumulibacter sp.]|jgi:hypothetical protein|nr:hypothetical protein [Accumulibacter sp.]
MRQRMRRMGFDGKIIAEAALHDQPPRVALEMALWSSDDGHDGRESGGENTSRWK